MLSPGKKEREKERSVPMVVGRPGRRLEFESVAQKMEREL